MKTTDVKKKCEHCDLFHPVGSFAYKGFCRTAQNYIPKDEKKPDWCPLDEAIEVYLENGRWKIRAMQNGIVTWASSTTFHFEKDAHVQAVWLSHEKKIKLSPRTVHRVKSFGIPISNSSQFFIDPNKEPVMGNPDTTKDRTGDL